MPGPKGGPFSDMAPRTGCLVRRLFQRMGSQYKHNKHERTYTAVNDADEPLSPSSTLAEKLDQALPVYAQHDASPCSCGGSWTYPIFIPQPEMIPTDASPFLDQDDSPVTAEMTRTIQNAVQTYSRPKLRKLSMQIWDKPELGWKEHFAHKTLTDFMETQGFTVTRHYLGLATAWRADFSRGEGRVIGINSEMDALPNIGHACGHNLIAVSGVAVALALKAAMEKHNIPGKIILLGTPAEESGGGKNRLLEKGAYNDMDICVMAHPGPGQPNGALISPWVGLQNIEVEFTGHSAHAAYAPWEAQNALDAAFLAYSSVSVLRQQIKPTWRVHGIVTGKDWEPNVIPDYAKMRWIVRAPTFAEVEVLRDRVIACFEAAALATSCQVKITLGEAYRDVRQSSALAQDFSRVLSEHLNMTVVQSDTVLAASSDFGGVSYKLPSLQPVANIPTEPNGGNHTPQFAESARSEEAHDACMQVAKGLAMTALRVLIDDMFYNKVREDFENDQKELEIARLSRLAPPKPAVNRVPLSVSISTQVKVQGANTACDEC